jgi:hypothetical protein
MSFFEIVATCNVTHQNPGKDVAVLRPMLARLVFGGQVNPDDKNSPTLGNCVEDSFAPDKIKKGWDKIGMIPWTTTGSLNPQTSVMKSQHEKAKLTRP